MGWERMTSQEFERITAVLKDKMSEGDIKAAVALGDYYYHGPNGNAKNTREAFPYWKHAADHGEMAVAGKVAACYMSGLGCEKSQQKGLHYFKMIADKGDKDAQFEVGECYEEGIGCEKNRILAKRYYEKAALQGHGEAQYALYVILYEEKHDDWLHWLCCSHMSGCRRATDCINFLIQKNFPKEAIEYQIDSIKKYGIDPRKHPSGSLSGSASSSASDSGSGGGCYIATCVYGSYDCPQVWTLRRFRDNILASTWYGRTFIRTYYAVSPTLVKWLGHTAWFRKMWRGKLDFLVKKLQSEGVKNTPYTDRDNIFSKRGGM